VTGLKVLTGFLLLLAGVTVTIPLPEFGIPLVLVGLRLLGERFEWARQANQWLDAKWSALRIRFHELPAVTRVAILGTLAVVAIALVWLAASHL
jgi:hypothetical protein